MAEKKRTSALPRVRIDSRLVPWKELTPQQQTAIENGHEVMASFAALEYEPPPPAESLLDTVLPRVEKERKSQTVLVDGWRGSGKTAVMNHLLEYWSYSLRRRQSPTAPRAEDVANKLDPIDDSGRIMPISLIDLQPLPEGTHLITHMGTTFEGVIRGMLAAEGVSTPSGVLGPWSKWQQAEEKVRSAWREFMLAMATWEGSGAQHGPIERYVVELQELTAGRHNLSASFKQMVDALLKWMRVGVGGRLMNGDPLFVLTIDDADMNPMRALQLLETIEILQHPRVAYLMTGNSSLFRTVVAESLRSRMGGRQNIDDTLLNWLEQLAADIYNRRVPEGNRFRLRPLLPEQRLRQVAKKLRQVKVQITRHKDEIVKKPLLQYFLHPRGEESEIDLIDFKEFTLAAYALPATIRGGLDLRDFVDAEVEAQKFSDVPVEEEWHVAAPVAIRLWEQSIRTPDLSPAVRDAIKPIVRMGGRAERSMVLDTTRVTSFPLLRKLQARIALEDDDDARGGLERRLEYSPQELADYEIHFAAEQKPLPSEVKGALVLATDLTADDPNGIFVAGSVAPGAFGHRLMVTSFESEVLSATIDFVWPLPEWQTFIDYRRCSIAWREELEKKKGERVPVAEAARLFMEIGFHVGRREPIRELNTPFDLLFHQMRVEAGDLLGVADARAKQMLFWIETSLLLLAAPESGLGRRTAVELLHARRMSGRHASELAHLRRERIRQSIVRTGRQRGQRLDAIQWFEAQQLRRGKQRLRRFTTVRPLNANVQAMSVHDVVESLIAEITYRMGGEEDPWVQLVEPQTPPTP